MFFEFMKCNSQGLGRTLVYQDIFVDVGLHTFKMHHRADLVNITIHAALADHMAGDALCFSGRRLQ